MPLKQLQCLSDCRWPSLVLSRKIVERFHFPRLSPPDDRWCNIIGSVPAGSVSSTSTLQIFREARPCGRKNPWAHNDIPAEREFWGTQPYTCRDKIQGHTTIYLQRENLGAHNHIPAGIKSRGTQPYTCKKIILGHTTIYLQG